MRDIEIVIGTMRNQAGMCAKPFAGATNHLTNTISQYVILAIFCLHPLLILFWYKGHFLLILFGVVSVVTIDLVKRRGRVWFDSSPLAAYLFLLLPIFSVLWSRYPDETVWSGSLVLANIGIIYLTMRANLFDSKAVISKLVIIVPIVFAITYVITYGKFGSIRPNSMEMGEVVKSIANVGPAMVVLCVPYLLLTPHLVRRKLIVWISLFACILVVLLSQSRGGMLMLALAFLLSVGLYPARISVRIVKLLKLTIVVVPFIFIFTISMGNEYVVETVIERFVSSQMVSSNGIFDPIKDEDDYHRALMYSEGIHAIYDEPVWGIGYGALAPYIEKRGGIGVVSHNIFITAWGEMGVPGLLAMLWLILSVFFMLRKYLKSSIVTRKDKLLLVATTVALVVAFIHAQFRPLFSNPIFPVLIAQAYATIRLIRKEAEV